MYTYIIYPFTDSLFGGLPELEFDGERLGQSMSIARFLATEFGLTGRTNIERAKCDGIVDAGIDMANAGFKFRSVQNQIHTDTHRLNR